MNSPLVSYCLITYNQEKFVTDAINSAFNQDYPNLEIIISDDCSTDRTPEIIEEMIAEYTGNHKIVFNRNKSNLGIRENCNKVWYELANGDFIIVAAGDDVSIPSRTKVYVDYFLRFPEVMSISCSSLQVDENLNGIYGEWDGCLGYSIFTKYDYMSFSDFINFSGDSRGLRRSVIEKFEPLKYSKSEDINTFVRSLLLGSICYIRQPFVKRRHHDKNASSTPSNGYEMLRKQFYVDFEYSLEKGYIDSYEYNGMKKKIDNMIEYSYLYDSPKRTNIKVIFYRFLRKYFKVWKENK